MHVQSIRARIKPEHVADVEEAADRMFAALEEARPTGIRYASTRSEDGRTFVVLLQVDEGTGNPLPSYDAFRDFQAGLVTWVEEPPTSERLTVVGSYRLF